MVAAPSMRSAWPYVLKLTSSSPVACRSKKPAPDIPIYTYVISLKWSGAMTNIVLQLPCGTWEAYLLSFWDVTVQSFHSSTGINHQTIGWAHKRKTNTMIQYITEDRFVFGIQSGFCSSGSKNNVVKMHCWLPTVCGASKIAIRDPENAQLAIVRRAKESMSLQHTAKRNSQRRDRHETAASCCGCQTHFATYLLCFQHSLLIQLRHPQRVTSLSWLRLVTAAWVVLLLPPSKRAQGSCTK